MTRSLAVAALVIALSHIGPGARVLAQEDTTLKTAGSAISKSGKTTSEMVSRDVAFIRNLVGISGGIPSELSDAWRQKFGDDKMTRKEVEETIASIWVEIRVGPKAIDKDAGLRIKDFADTIGTLVKLTVQSEPKDAKVYMRIEENYVGNTEVRRWVVPGKLRVIIKKEGLGTSDETIEVPNRNHTYKKSLPN